MAGESRRREAEFAAKDKARREKEHRELKKREQARAAEQAEWLKTQAQKRTNEAKKKAAPPSPEPPPKPRRPSVREEEKAAAPDEKAEMERERDMIEELRQRMARRAEEIATQAKEVAAAAQSEGSYFFAPEARPSQTSIGSISVSSKQTLFGDTQERFPSESQVVQSARPKSRSSSKEAAVPAQAEEASGATWADIEEVGNNISSFFANTFSDPSSWFGSRPIRQEATMPPKNCPKCGSAMPQTVGANFCPRCKHVIM